MKYYKTYPVKKDAEEIDPNGYNYYYGVKKAMDVFDEKLDIVEWYSNQKIKNVIYKVKRTDRLLNIYSYHLTNYGNIIYQTEISFNKILLTTYQNQIVLNVHFIETDLIGNIIRSYTLNAEHVLTEYRETFRNECGDVVKEKIFYPES